MGDSLNSHPNLWQNASVCSSSSKPRRSVSNSRVKSSTCFVAEGKNPRQMALRAHFLIKLKYISATQAMRYDTPLEWTRAKKAAQSSRATGWTAPALSGPCGSMMLPAALYSSSAFLTLGLDLILGPHALTLSSTSGLGFCA